MSKTWDEMESRERSEFVAPMIDFRVEGDHHGEFWAGEMSPGSGFFDWQADIEDDVTQDPTLDYRVLKHVRDTWGCDEVCRFRDELQKLWERRAEQRCVNGRYVCGPNQYEPGDYSHAAYLATREGVGDG